MPKIGVVIQARVSSSRLPGKVLMPILGKTLLERVVDRMRLSQSVSSIVVATSTDPSDEPLCRLMEEKQIAYVRGPLSDVLERYFLAAQREKLDVVVRVTADCPLIDAAVIDQAVAAHVAGDFDATFCSESIPDGFRFNILRFDALKACREKATLPSEREHVVPYIWNHPEDFRVNNFGRAGSASKWHLSVDYAEDLVLVTKIYEELYSVDPGFSLEEVLALMMEKKDLERLNATVVRVDGYQKSVAEEALNYADLLEAEKTARRWAENWPDFRLEMTAYFYALLKGAARESSARAVALPKKKPRSSVAKRVLHAARLVQPLVAVQKNDGILFSGAEQVLDPLVRVVDKTRFTPVWLKTRFDRHSLRQAFGAGVPTFTLESKDVFAPTADEERPNYLFRGRDFSEAISAKTTELQERLIPSLRLLETEMGKILMHRRVRLVVLDEDATPRQRALVRACEKLNIPSAVCQHGLLGDPIGYVPISARYFLAWGEESAKKLYQWGADMSRVYVLGAPRYDRLFGNATRPGSRRAVMVILSKSKPVGGGGRSGIDHLTLDYLTRLLTAVRASLPAGTDLWVKPHPGENHLHLLQKAASAFCRFVDAKKPASEFMPGLSAVIGTESGAMAEAMIMGVPSICINFSGKPDVYPLVGDGVSLGAYSAEELRSQLERLHSERYRTEFSEKRKQLLPYYFQYGGAAAKKTAEFLFREVLR